MSRDLSIWHLKTGGTKRVLPLLFLDIQIKNVQLLYIVVCVIYTQHEL